MLGVGVRIPTGGCRPSTPEIFVRELGRLCNTDPGSNISQRLKIVPNTIVEAPTMETEYRRLAELISANASSHPKSRYIVAIAGAPGSGKTTTATAIASQLNTGFSHRAAVLSMDGFHLPRSTLDRLPNSKEAYIRRGAPWTFDAAAFVAFMRRLRSWADMTPSAMGGIYAPTFDHETKDPVANGVMIPDNTSIIIVEGNYLLLDEDPWRDVAALVDYRVFVDVDLQEARLRLAKRHMAAGIEPTVEAGLQRVDANDYLNGLLIKEKLIRPDLVVRSVANGLP
ncbi:P-loop containing nucleoside triphosphate hydrolase protein [Aspergillus californicus]